MFCPRCGKADQTPESYCRQCGVFLPDLDKASKAESTPEEHIKINAVLSFLTIVASFTLAILLYAVLAFRPDTHLLIYLTAGLLIAIGIWQIQTFIRSLKLRKHFRKKRLDDSLEAELTDTTIEGLPTGKFLNEADVGDQVPASVTDATTKHLVER